MRRTPERPPARLLMVSSKCMRVEGLKASSCSIFSCSRAAARATNAGTNIVRPGGMTSNSYSFIFSARSSKYGRLSDSPRFKSLALARRSIVSMMRRTWRWESLWPTGISRLEHPRPLRLIFLVGIDIGCQRKRLVERIDGSAVLGEFALDDRRRIISIFARGFLFGGNPALHDTTRDGVPQQAGPTSDRRIHGLFQSGEALPECGAHIFQGKPSQEAGNALPTKILGDFHRAVLARSVVRQGRRIPEA